jgi:GrpB-like predicted nucleotidyltransferase (UPF0157 family)
MQSDKAIDDANEDRLRAVTIGEIQPLNGTIRIDLYNPAWPDLYEDLEAKIRSALGVKALRIEHVGSTSIPGLFAKPLIDIVLVVADSRDEESYVPKLEHVGFVLRIREPDWFEHRLLRAPVIAGNVHVFSQGCEEVGRMIAFRDHVRADQDDRELYERTKQALAARTWKHVQNYADAKSDVIREIMTRTGGVRR